jgi:hypothetical protein
MADQKQRDSSIESKGRQRKQAGARGAISAADVIGNESWRTEEAEGEEIFAKRYYMPS